MGRLEAAKTGHNPFYSQQTGGGMGMGMQQFPAQTGPAGGFGLGGQQNVGFGGGQQSGFAGSANPFGRAPQAQGQSQSQQGAGAGGSLIDF